MSDVIVTKPTFLDTVDQRDLLSPLGSPTDPISYLDRFPDELYDKSPDSHLVKFLYTILGPAGIGWLKKDLLDIRLALTSQAVQGFALERFYGDPFAFGRVLDEIPAVDPDGLVISDEESKIRAQDAAYRNRCLDFMAAASLGTTPEGMRLAARSGLGYDVDVIENYQALFDAHSDEPKGFTYYGKTTSLNEFIIVPRKEESTSEIKVLTFEDATITDGTFILVFGGQATVPLAWDSSFIEVQNALQALGTIGLDNVEVWGGPCPNPFNIYFTGALADQNVPDLTVISSLVDSNLAPKTITITTEDAGRDASTEVMSFSDAQMHTMQAALDRLRPVNTLPTFAVAPSRRKGFSVDPDRPYYLVLRYVTGLRNVRWPKPDKIHWIEGGIEVEAPKPMNGAQHHYLGWHDLAEFWAYTDQATSDPNYEITRSILARYNSEQVGPFPRAQAKAILLLATSTGVSKEDFPTGPHPHTAEMAGADYPEPPVVTSRVGGVGLIRGIYPTDYVRLPGVAKPKYKGKQFWASRARPTGSEILEINLRTPQVINHIRFDAIAQPVRYDIQYDVLDQAPRRHFMSVTPATHGGKFEDEQHFQLGVSPWQTLEFSFYDATGQHPIYASTIRIIVTRLTSGASDSAYLWDPVRRVQEPWCVFIRNLRIGRLVY